MSACFKDDDPRDFRFRQRVAVAENKYDYNFENNELLSEEVWNVVKWENKGMKSFLLDSFSCISWQKELTEDKKKKFCGVWTKSYSC